MFLSHRVEHTFLIRIVKWVEVVRMNIVNRLVEGIGAHGRRRFLILVFQEVQLVDQLCCGKVQNKVTHTTNSNEEE